MTELEEGVPPTELLANGARQGVNDFENLGYGGPCPPRAGKLHSWVFKVYALDIEVDLEPGATKADLLSTMSGHILAKGDLAREYRQTGSMGYGTVDGTTDPSETDSD